MHISNETYDVMKAISIIILPAIITCYSTIAMIWGVPYTEQVVATLGAINVLIGALTKLSTKAYLEADAVEDDEDE